MAVMGDGTLNNIRIYESILTGKKQKEEEKVKREERKGGKEGLPYNKMPTNKYRRSDGVKSSPYNNFNNLFRQKWVTDIHTASKYPPTDFGVTHKRK